MRRGTGGDNQICARAIQIQKVESGKGRYHAKKNGGNFVENRKPKILQDVEVTQ